MAWVEGRCPRMKVGYLAGAVWLDGTIVADKMPSSLVDLARIVVKECQWESGRQCDCPLKYISQGIVPPSNEKIL